MPCNVVPACALVHGSGEGLLVRQRAMLLTKTSHACPSPHLVTLRSHDLFLVALQLGKAAAVHLQRRSIAAPAIPAPTIDDSTCTLPSAMLHRRLYRSLLHTIRQFKRDGLPLTGLAGSEGQAILPGSTTSPHDVARLVRQLFQQPAPGMTEDTAFAALRVLNAQHQALTSASDAQAACSAWLRHVHAPQPQTDAQHPASRILADSLLQTSQLVTQLHQAKQEDGADDDLLSALEDDSTDDSDPSQQTYQEVLSVLQQQGLPAALQHMADDVSQQLPTSPPSTTDPPSTQTATTQLQAVQHYIYRVLKLRHEPIEWLYDGLAPLLPAAALQRRKAAPFTLAVLVSMLCARMGLHAVPLRAAPPTMHVAPGKAAVAGGVVMPDDVAARQAGRTAAYIPSDSWLVAVIQPAVPSQGQQTTSRGNAQEHTWRGRWQLAGLFLDVSVRGGKVMTEADVRSTYPEALAPYDQGQSVLGAGATHQQLCVDWVRAVLVAHQRRGESDLVAHWLVQLLALDPAAPEWDYVLSQYMQPEFKQTTA